MTKPGSKSARAWLFYDMGSSAYALSVGTLFYPLFFNEFAGRGRADSLHWGVAILLSSLLIGGCAPLLGAYADKRQKWNIVFQTTGWLSVVGTALLPLTASMSPWLAVSFFVAIHVSFNLATNMYDSYLSLFGAADNNYSRRSSQGWALGYLGGLICLGITFLALRFNAPSSLADFWVVFLVCAVMYGSLSAFVFSRLPDEGGLSTSRKGTLKSVLETIRSWRERRLFFSYIIGSIMVVDGMTTLLYFMSIYASEKLHFSVAQLAVVFAIMQAVAVPSTWFLPKLIRYCREAYLVVLSCVCWIFLTVLFALGPSYSGLLWLAAGGGLVIGTTPALLRGLLGHLVPPDNRAELFGFAALAGRVGATLGPLVYIITLKLIGLTAAILSSVPAFVLGAVVFLRLARKLPSEK